MPLSSFAAWLKEAWTDFLSWFGVEEQKIASFLYPIFLDAKQLVESDLMHDIIDGVPAVAAALFPEGGTMDLAAGLKAAEDFLLPLLEKQGVELAHTTINTLSNGMVAQAQTANATLTSSDAAGGASEGNGAA